MERTVSDESSQVQLIRMSGELDLATADGLAERGYAAIGRGPRVLLIDLSRVSFCDAHGLGALVRIANHADRVGCHCGLLTAQPQVVHLLRLTDLGERLPVFATPGDALAQVMHTRSDAHRESASPGRSLSPNRGDGTHPRPEAMAVDGERDVHMRQTAGFQETLRRLAMIDEALVEDQAGLALGPAEGSSLDPKTEALLRMGATAAIGASPVCLEWSTARALAAGASEDEIADVLLAIEPVTGLGRIVSAAPGVALALGYDTQAAPPELRRSIAAGERGSDESGGGRGGRPG